MWRCSRRGVVEVVLPGTATGPSLPIAVPVGLALLSLLTGPFAVAGVDLVAGQPATAIILVAAGVQAWRQRRLGLDLTSVLLLVPAAVAVLQQPRLGAQAGGVGVFVPMAVAAAVLPTFRRRDADTAALPYVVLGAVITVWMSVLVMPALLDPASGFYDIKAAAELPIGGGNFLGGVLLVPIVLLLAREREGPRWPTAALALLTVGLALTLSRAAWLAGAAVLALWWWRRRRRDAGTDRGRRLALTLGAAALVVATVLGAGLLVTGGSDRLGAVLSPAAGARATIWQAGVEAVAEEPVLGYGLYGFEEVAARHGRPENHPHNLVLAAVGMFGLAGLAYLAWWALALADAFGDRRVEPFGVALLALFLHAQLDAWTFHLPFEILAITLVGMVRARTAPEPGGGTVSH